LRTIWKRWDRLNKCFSKSDLQKQWKATSNYFDAFKENACEIEESAEITKGVPSDKHKYCAVVYKIIWCVFVLDIVCVSPFCFANQTLNRNIFPEINNRKKQTIKRQNTFLKGIEVKYPEGNCVSLNDFIQRNEMASKIILFHQEESNPSMKMNIFSPFNHVEFSFQFYFLFQCYLKKHIKSSHSFIFYFW
jgi:hypothetical protein